MDSSQSELIQQALTALGEGDSALRARLLAQLSLALYYSGEMRMRLSQEAVEMARRVEDKPAQLAALYSRCVSLEGFEKAEERLAAATEIVQVAQQSGDKEMALRVITVACENSSSWETCRGRHKSLKPMSACPKSCGNLSIYG